jgi:hypothetical protein
LLDWPAATTVTLQHLTLVNYDNHCAPVLDEVIGVLLAK